MRRAPILSGFAVCVLAAAVADATDLADPTAPPRGASLGRSARPPSVTAILISAGRRIAIVDGAAVGAGDRVGPITIEAVLEDGVRYTRGGRRAFAPLPRAVRLSPGEKP